LNAKKEYCTGLVLSQAVQIIQNVTSDINFATIKTMQQKIKLSSGNHGTKFKSPIRTQNIDGLIPKMLKFQNFGYQILYEFVRQTVLLPV